MVGPTREVLGEFFAAAERDFVMEPIKGLDNEALANAVLERMKGDLAALKKEQLLAVNLDISAAVATVLGVLPEVNALREQIVKELPSFDVARFDKLEDCALALSFAQAKYLSATQPPDGFDELAAEAARLRERLLAETKALVHHGLVSDAQLGQLKGANGYKNVATDLMVLTNIMQAGWAQIQGKTPTTAQDLEQASRVATRFLRVVGQREQGPEKVAEATELRLRAYTLMLLAYEDARRAVTYLRAPHGDVDTIIPSLYPGRPRRRGGEPDALGSNVARGAPASPLPIPNVGTAGGASAPAALASAAAAQPAMTGGKGPFV
jgi:hypothetical protein